MRVAALEGRAVLIAADTAVDVAEASGGRFGSDPMALFEDWAGFTSWADTIEPGSGSTYERSSLTCPVPAPGQIFAIGINYGDHGSEVAMEVPDDPMVFTKFPSAVAGPFDDIPLVPGNCDWEVELVVVIGRTARDIDLDDAAAHIAGFAVGQDLSERTCQLAGAYPQFSLAKSHANFAPIGPEIVTLDELDDPWDLEIRCDRNDTTEQLSRTSMLIHDVPSIITYLSSTCELRAGDLIFTGTPSGVGLGRVPPDYLVPGDVLTSTIEGVGAIVNRCI
ncbi:MAG: fumarylacetoacetate hydrolase family protein [Acidimicrobiia bacterium]|nr:fumarylacetoacetate hydrolase family protein [Acidimicrobiia bacterium]